MTRSIRSRLTAYLLSGTGLLIVAASIVLGTNVSRWLGREFDRALEAKARALVTLTKQEHGEVELDFADEFMPEFESPADSQYFELWLDGETLLERSNSFEIDAERSRASLPRTASPHAAPRFADIPLPDGRPGRLVRIDFVPQIEDLDDGQASGESAAASEPILDPTRVLSGSRFHTATLLVARERETLDARLARFHWSLVWFTVLILGSLAVLTAVALKIGLRPLDRLALQVRGLEAESLDRQVEVGAPPRELAPVVEQLNKLLERLERAFRHERQLTSDIAHELKTPIAELRNLCEVGIRWPDDPVTARRFFEDAWGIARQMERVVVHLLALARCDEGAAEVRSSPVALTEALQQAWTPLAGQAEEARLVLESRGIDGAVLQTDPDKLRLILSNLLSNAVEHSRPGTAITCRATVSPESSFLSLSNYVTHLDAEDLALMFDRFWRKDKARTGGRNVGLGLAIVRAFSDLLGFEIETKLDTDHLLTITLSRSNREAASSPPRSSA